MIEVLEELALSPLAVRHDRARPRFPAIFDIVTLWARENPEQPETGLGRLLLLSPQGETLLEQTMDVDLRQNKRLRTFGKIVGFPIRGPGLYHFRVDGRPSESASWHEVAKIPLEVSIEEIPDQPRPEGETPAIT